MNGLHRRGGKDGEGPRAKLGRLGGAHGLFGAAAAALLLAARVSVLTPGAKQRLRPSRRGPSTPWLSCSA